MKLHLMFAFLGVFLCLSAFLFAVSAQALTVGVRKGDSFTYYMGAEYTSNVANATVTVPEFEANNTDWVRIDITGSNGTIITSFYTLHYKNGTDQTLNGQTDIAQNTWNNPAPEFRGVPICPANLQAGDEASTLQLSINQTTTQNILGQNRQLNHITWNNTIEHGDIYFDKTTGMLVDMYRAHAFINTQTGEIVTKADIIKLTKTNAWQNDTFSANSVYLTALALTISLTVMIIARKYSPKKKVQ
jgi:hypothetical protein